MSDMIYREDAINVLEKLSACEEYGVEVGTDEETYIGKYEAIIEIRDLPSAYRPQGEWIPSDTDGFVCSVCENGYRNQPTLMGRPMFEYCPVCGAHMKGADDE